MIAKKILLLAVLLTGGCITSYAQYDDDIYYNPAKDKKTQADHILILTLSCVQPLSRACARQLPL